MKYIKIIWLLMMVGFYCPSVSIAQSDSAITTGLSLEECIDYALNNRPLVEQAQIDERINNREINARLSAWLPQVSAQFNATHNILLQTAAFGDQLITIGMPNTSNLLFQANQTLYSNDLLLAGRAARFTRIQQSQIIKDTKINTVVAVTKAFYNVLLTHEQIRILNENILRLEKQYADARNRYEAGLVDKTDFQRASITLKNTKSDLKRAHEMVKANTAYLKELMGFREEVYLELEYDYSKMQEHTLMDTTQLVEISNRIEYQQLKTQEQLLVLNTSYYRLGFLPTISGFYNYNYLFFGNNLSELYNTSYPTSSIGLSIALPIFQGTRRVQNLRMAQLLEGRLEEEGRNLKNTINTEYQSALANYKSDLNDWQVLQENVEVAEEVYDIIKLQYDEGVKTYLDLIVAETDLRTAQLNYYNALYQVLSSKLDLERALGIIEVN